MTRPIFPAAIALAILLLAFAPRGAGAEGGWTTADTHAAIRQASARYSVSYRLLDRIVSCETGETYDPYSRGDWDRVALRYRSFGAIQLNDRPTGLIHHYRRVTGGASAFDPYSSVAYLARVARGDFPGIRLSRWSCWRVINGG